MSESVSLSVEFEDMTYAVEVEVEDYSECDGVITIQWEYAMEAPVNTENFDNAVTDELIHMREEFLVEMREEV